VVNYVINQSKRLFKRIKFKQANIKGLTINLFNTYLFIIGFIPPDKHIYGATHSVRLEKHQLPAILDLGVIGRQ